jgi:hypothetical protein
MNARRVLHCVVGMLWFAALLAPYKVPAAHTVDTADHKVMSLLSTPTPPYSAPTNISHLPYSCRPSSQVGSCLGSFLKSFGDAALPYVEGLMPSIAPLLDKARPDEERRIAMCIIDDMLEHSAQGRAKYLGQVRVLHVVVVVVGCGSRNWGVGSSLGGLGHAGAQHTWARKVPRAGACYAHVLGLLSFRVYNGVQTPAWMLLSWATGRAARRVEVSTWGSVGKD